MSWNAAMKELGEEINRKMVDQFALQGHKLTGKFEESLEVLPDGTGVSGIGNTYGIYVNIGVKPEQIKYPYARARIDGLTNFVKLRMGVDGKAAVGIAYAIATKHKDEGMPTAKSYRYSSNGKRTDFIDDAIAQVDVESILLKHFVDIIDTQKNVTGR